jgi:hypothetical protein
MSTTGWIFMVGLRVFDVGLLIVWLVWFFRLRDDEDPPEDDGGGGGGPRGPEDAPDGGGGLLKPLGRATPSARRLRGHDSPHRRTRRRGAEPLPRPVPVRVRRTRTPAPVRRVA